MGFTGFLGFTGMLYSLLFHAVSPPHYRLVKGEKRNAFQLDLFDHFNEKQCRLIVSLIVVTQVALNLF